MEEFGMKKALINISGRSNSGPVIGIELAKSLYQNGYDVYAVVAKDALNFEDWLGEKSLKDIYVLKTYTDMKNLVPFTIKFHLVEKRKIRDRFRKIQFDYVFKPIFHIWAEDIAAQVSAKKVVTLCHDPIMHSGESWIKHFLYKRHIKNSDEVVVLTRSFIPTVCQNYGFKKSNVHYMPHGLMKLYKEKQDKSIPLLYDAEHINFVFFGRIQKYKGVGILIEAYERIRKEYNNVTLTIAGKGKLEDIELKSDSEKGIRIVNKYIPDEKVGCYFDGPNVVTVLPYLDATQSGVIPIAIEYGTPIIASDTGGLKEQMLDGKFGIFAKVGDVCDLAEKMKLFIEKREMFLKQQSMMKVAMKHFEWKEVVANLLKEI
ncbi:Glycosyltransferase involved in cell wall bisynthesis [Lachnospiraceae bacterium NLAE-zl-G231]|nr:Glycosyltransferase involved in cell wall bisynthesis [Lachnospiraceae bacterium NLAE-zl-G231]